MKPRQRLLPYAPFARVQGGGCVQGGGTGLVTAKCSTTSASEGVDAIVVIFNDSDSRLPVQQARRLVPVGIVSPHGRVAGDLQGRVTDGVGNHWWAQLTSTDFTAAQPDDPVTRYPRSAGW